MAIRLTNDAPIGAYEGVDRVPNRPAPTIAVPTTAGSGSEVSNALVLHEPGRSTELVVRGRGCEPRAAILDARLLRGLPENPLLFAALDALAHCLESLWAVGRTSFTTALALEAADRIIDLLPSAVAGVASGANRSGENDEVLQQLLEASSMANMACGNSGLGLVHALASAVDVTLAHGLQTGLLLPHVANFNAQTLAPPARALLPRVDALYTQLGFEASYAVASSDPVPAGVLVRATQGHPFRANNARPSSDEEVAEVALAAGATR
ncbi:iron-containing alcohol dehydrogenase [Microbacterium pygmaeum]|uniref:iron-containing alcohol dehydrogenase n=1 Tax=Microbacterium pygmaeum TaxID=370764 RepID=UPI000B89A2E8|nr:iron-containing alcohol dehydrogenase [Microbacterium pygmaeum]